MNLVIGEGSYSNEGYFIVEIYYWSMFLMSFELIAELLMGCAGPEAGHEMGNRMWNGFPALGLGWCIKIRFSCE